ncbi:hypothetical protein OS493_018173 [Desmophyllum pertusum]|uniref:diacylglycerol O-acyltransferase n=1 Tax=Desmophyllum pertusum TaxID=174260 RepID=A0A9W9YNH3_9CNID|nr:hypothetical protein OS493_018173 [Desmophyllum pertusum]
MSTVEALYETCMHVGLVPSPTLPQTNSKWLPLPYGRVGSDKNSHQKATADPSGDDSGVHVSVWSYIWYVFALGASIESLHHHFAVLYLGWAFILNPRTPSRGGRTIEAARRWKIWKYYCEYFPIHLIKTADLDPKENYIFGYHPHGIIGIGALGNFCGEATGFSENFPGIYPHLLTLTVNFRFPFSRDYSMSFGACSVDKDSIEYILQKMGPGHSAAIVIGGAAESLESKAGKF